MSLTVRAAGPATTVQDRGRTGFSGAGVGRSGVADRVAAADALRLVGAPADAALLEVTLGPCEVQAGPDPVPVAVTGAAGPLLLDGRPVAAGQRVLLPPGGRLLVGAVTSGLRRYLAAGGGFDVAPVLGSASTDTLAGLGPPPVRDGDVLGVLAGGPGTHERVAPRTASSPAVLGLRPGPRVDWFTPDALELLTGSSWTVDPRSSRVGLRLQGPTLPRAREDELPSEGLVRGALQVPPGDHPVLFGADHPVTGGYPVLGVVTEAGCDLAAQLPAGAEVRFVLVGERTRT